MKPVSGRDFGSWVLGGVGIGIVEGGIFAGIGVPWWLLIVGGFLVAVAVLWTPIERACVHGLPGLRPRTVPDWQDPEFWEAEGCPATAAVLRPEKVILRPARPGLRAAIARDTPAFIAPSPTRPRPERRSPRMPAAAMRPYVIRADDRIAQPCICGRSITFAYPGAPVWTPPPGHFRSGDLLRCTPTNRLVKVETA